MTRRFIRMFLAPAVGESMPEERSASLASVRAFWVGLAIALDISLYLLLRSAPGLRPDVIRVFAIVNISLMVIDFAVTRVALRRVWRGFRASLVLCVLCEAIAAIVWIQMTGSISSYFLIVGFLLILLYRLLFDYKIGLVCAIAVALSHTGVFVLESLGALRPASLFVSPPLGIYENSMFRVSAMLSLLVGYAITFVAVNFFVCILREKEAALRAARADLARVVDETQNQGRLCGQVLVDRYELDELLGRGGMGDVYHGRRLDDGLAVAVKVLHLHLADQHEIRERFRREAMLVSRIPNAHVPRIFEGGRTADGQEFIVMEYLNGDDLAAVLRRRGPLPLAEVTAIVEKVASALEAAHAAGVVHRDLKPQNVFILVSGEVRLLDFGIARLQDIDGLTLTNELLGSPGYMAPEQARGSARDVGPHTDVFALGAVAYRALTGKSPFPSRAPAAAVYEALHMDPPPPSSILPDLPQDVDYVIALALAKRSADRYARPSHFAGELRLAATGDLAEASRVRARGLASSGDAPATGRILDA